MSTTTMIKPVKEMYELPKGGIPDDELLAQISSFKEQDEARWKSGQVSGGIYHGDDVHLALQNHALSMFAVSNPLHGDIWPSVVKMEAEVISMTSNLVNGGDKGVCGAITSGGTESILMSLKTHRAWAESRGITEPEVIGCHSSHAGLDKACDLLKIKMIKVPFDPVSCEMLVDKVAEQITENTIMVYSSAPNYPHGVIDPIGALSDLVMSQPKGKPIGLHVDCCLGGFFLPFAKNIRDDIPDFDFTCPGVTAMSCDTHKYGYAAKGTSVVLYRNKELRNHQFFAYPAWTGGMYVTPTTAGSRPGALSAACWIAMMRLGHDGYMDATRQILSVVGAVETACHETEGLFVLGDPKAMIVAFGSNDFNIYALSDRMNKRGFGMSPCQSPACLHLCVTLRHCSPGTKERLVKALKEETAILMADPEKGGDARVAIYGNAESQSGADESQATTGTQAGDSRYPGMLRYMSKVLDMPKKKTKSKL